MDRIKVTPFSDPDLAAAESASRKLAASRCDTLHNVSLGRDDDEMETPLIFPAKRPPTPAESTRSKKKALTKRKLDTAFDSGIPEEGMDTEAGPSREDVCYLDYINSPDFKNDSVAYAVKKCRELASRDRRDIQNVWDQIGPLLDNLVKEGKNSIARVLLDSAPDGPSTLRLLMKGFQLGVESEKSDQGRNALMGLSGALETAGIMVTKLHQESHAHQEQSLAFINQMNNASDTVAQMSNAVDRMKIELIKLQLQTKIPGPAAPSPDTEAPTPMDITPPVHTPESIPVAMLSGPGTYQSKYGLVKIGEQGILSMDESHPLFISLKSLTTVDVKLVQFLLNRNLDKLVELAQRDPIWFERILSMPKEARKKELGAVIKGIEFKKFQWNLRV